MAVILALTLPRLLVFFKYILPAIWKFFSKHRNRFPQLNPRNFFRRRTQGENTDSADPIPLVDLAPPPRARFVDNLDATLGGSASYEVMVREILNSLAMPRVELPDGNVQSRWHNIKRNFEEDAWAFTWLVAILALIFLVAVGQQMIAITVASIVADSTALLVSPHCGAWVSKLYSHPRIFFGVTNETSQPVTNYPNERTLQAVSYAETCYGPKTRAGECLFFYKDRIPFEEVHNSTCPFKEDICLYGRTSSYTLDTGFIDSSILGFNMAHRCQFRLQSTCTPAAPIEPYVRITPTDKPGSQRIEYRFGNLDKFPGPEWDENTTQFWTFGNLIRDDIVHAWRKAHNILLVASFILFVYC